MLIDELLRRQRPDGGWGYRLGAQASIEATALAVLAVFRTEPSAARRALNFLRRTQNHDGSWPAFAGDDRLGCWSTALALIASQALDSDPTAQARAADWLTGFKGREGHWLWRWKFKVFDTKVRFDSDKFGWPWIDGTVSWVIPTAFSLIALKRAYPTPMQAAVSVRVIRGAAMLRDRMCPGGGWNAGNSFVLGVPMVPYVDATAIALLALSDGRTTREAAISLHWLAAAAASCSAPYSLAWAILALAAYRVAPIGLAQQLDRAIQRSIRYLDTTTLATASLALQAPPAVDVFGTRS
jgi:hypothetical protein